MQELEVARRAAQRAGDVIRRCYREGVAWRSKSIANLVSDADLQAEQAIVATIREAFPDHSILAEEQDHGRIGGEHLWVVDPLDGTNNFAHHVPHFAVSIAYFRGGVAELGVIYQPVREEWYVAQRGQGAFRNDERLAVTPAGKLDEILVGVGFYYDRGVLMEATLAAIGDLFRQRIHGIRRFGTASLDLCHVACGMYGAFFEYTLAPWDFAAGRLLVQEAGGQVTTALGEPLQLEQTSLLASNGLVHEAMLEVTRKHYPQRPANAPDSGTQRPLQ